MEQLRNGDIFEAIDPRSKQQPSLGGGDQYTEWGYGQGDSAAWGNWGLEEGTLKDIL